MLHLKYLLSTIKIKGIFNINQSFKSIKSKKDTKVIVNIPYCHIIKRPIPFLLQIMDYREVIKDYIPF